MMTPAYNVALAYANLADLGTFTSTVSAIATAPVSRLQNHHVGRKARWLNDSVGIICDLGSAKTLDTLGMFGIGSAFTTSGTTRVRVSTSDATGVAGDLYDSTAQLGKVDESYGYLVTLLSAPVAGRYVRWDCSLASIMYFEAGRAFVGARTQFGVNFQPGWSRGYVDQSRVDYSRGGQRHIDPEVQYRTCEIKLSFLSATERNGIVESIDRINGEKTDVLLIADPSSTNLGRDCIWGFIDGNSPVFENNVLITPMYEKSYKFRERL